MAAPVVEPAGEQAATASPSTGCRPTIAVLDPREGRDTNQAEGPAGMPARG